MENYVIKASGTMEEITKALKTMQAVFGRESRLEEVAKATRYGRLETAVRKQFNEGEN